ncbi:hypothetical protein COLO4_13239 [Corchorus olitorius]|uniref:Uncharacterized protein n=1 Tax=Corchorus olitorius TaxID=93759 RepID=A0A1R3JXE4_9ROSI|nr:hypothetical protein COLO4_13239 [Corchorus olitorius]
MSKRRKARANRGPMDEDEPHFITVEAKLWYDKMATNDFVVEQRVPTSIDEEYHITAAFAHFGWAPILNLPDNYCPRLVDFLDEHLEPVPTTSDDNMLEAFGFINRNGTWENDHRAEYQSTPLVQIPAPPRRAKKKSAASSSTHDDPELTACLDAIEGSQTQLLAGQTELLAGQAELRGYFLHITQHLGLQPPPP